LTDRLLEELPSILLWSIAGYRRLYERGHFVQPRSAAELMEEMEDLASPIGAFVRECCEVGPGREVHVRDLYEKWKWWCDQKGRKGRGTERVSGRDLGAAVPSFGVRQSRLGGDRVRVYEGIRLRDEMPN